jgi:hypothetical protein
MSVLVNLWSQVRKTLNLDNGGTGNTEGWATGVIKVCTNRTGSTITLNTLVKLAGTYNDARVTPTTASTDKVMGVVVGYWDPDQPNVLIQADAPDLSLVAVLTHGTARVKLNSGGATRGQYAFPSSTSGSASSSATVANGAFGVFQGSGGASGTALVTLTGTQGVGVGAATTFGTPALTLGTANAAGAATTAIRTDATILAFDATTPASSPLGGAGSVGAAAVAARRDHVHPITGALDALSDVTAPAPVSGDVLTWTGSAWVNQSPGAASNIWRPVMGYNGTGYEVIVDAGSGGTALMGYGPT